MEVSPLRQEAARGYEESGGWRWKFWKRDQLNLEEARACLDRLESLPQTPEETAVLRMTRACGPNLGAARYGLDQLARGVTADLAGLAGIAIALRDLAEHDVTQQLKDAVPGAHTMKELVPDPEQFLHKLTRGEPATPEAWAETLPEETVKEAVDRVGSPEARAAWRELKALPLEQPERLARQLLRYGAPDLGELSDADTIQVGRWCLRDRQDPLVKAFGDRPPEELAKVVRLAAGPPYRAAQAAEALKDVLPPGRLAKALAAIEPGPALSLLAGVPTDEAARRGLDHLELPPPLLLEKLALGEEETRRRIPRDEPLIAAALDQPVAADIILKGWQAAARTMGSPTQVTAAAGLGMARATTDLNLKLYLAQGALKAMRHPVADKILALSQLDGPNATWSQAALALAGLRSLAESPTPGVQDLLRTAAHAGSTWAGQEWRALLNQAMDLEVEDLATVLEDPILREAAGGAPQTGGVWERPDGVVIGGVRLDKRTREGSGPRFEDSQPVVASAAAEAFALGPPPPPGTHVGIEFKEAYKSGLCGIYNPVTGERLWKESYKSGVALLFSPTEGVKEKEAYKSGVALALDPQTGKVLEHEAYKSGVCWTPSGFRESYKGCIAAARHPKTGEHVVHEAYKSGVAVVANPATGEVQQHEAYKSGVAGAFDPATGQVRFHESYKSGVGVISSDPEYPTLSSSCFPYWEDDDPYD